MLSAMATDQVFAIASVKCGHSTPPSSGYAIVWQQSSCPCMESQHFVPHRVSAVAEVEVRPQHAPVLRVRHCVAAISPLKPAAAIAGLLRLDQQPEIRRLEHAPAIGKRMQDSFCNIAVLTDFCTTSLSVKDMPSSGRYSCEKQPGWAVTCTHRCEGARERHITTCSDADVWIAPQYSSAVRSSRGHRQRCRRTCKRGTAWARGDRTRCCQFWWAAGP